MDNTDCRSFMIYMDDMIDGQAEENVKTAFNEHLQKCEKCRTKYEIYQKIQQILTSSLPEPSPSLADDISRRLDSLEPITPVKPIEPKHLAVRFSLILTAVAVVTAGIVLLFSLMFNTIRDTDSGQRIHLDEQGSVKKMVLSDKEGTYFINDEFFDMLSVSASYRTDTKYTYHQILNALESVGRLYESEYGGVVFVLSGTFDTLNISKRITYYPSSTTGSLAFFSYSASYAVFTEEFEDLYEEFYLKGTSDDLPLLVVVCLA